MMRVCSIEGCGKPHSARGWCGMHYRRVRRYGDPLTVLRRAKHVVEHGTYNEYQNYGCRCAECKAAASEYRRAHLRTETCVSCGKEIWRRRDATGLCMVCLGASRRTAGHGSEALYHRGCRCDLCRAASAAARRAHRHANIEATRAYDRRRRAKAAA